MAFRLVVDWLAWNVTPYLFLLIFSTAAVEGNTVTQYLFFLGILGLILIGTPKTVIELLRKNWLQAFWPFLKGLANGIWLSASLRMTILLENYWSRLLVLTTSLLITSLTTLYIWHYLDLLAILRNTFNFFFRDLWAYLLDAPRLVAALRDWLREIVVGYVLDTIREFWQFQVACAEKRDPAGIVIGIIVVLFFIGIMWLVSSCLTRREQQQVQAGRNQSPRRRV